MATKRQSFDEIERRYHAMTQIDAEFRRYVRVPLWMRRHVMERQKERDDRERERNYEAWVLRDVEQIMSNFRKLQQKGRERYFQQLQSDRATTSECVRESVDRETMGLDIGLNDSDLAIMESPPQDRTDQGLWRSVEDQTMALIAADATKQQIIEIELAIEQLRAAGITEEEIQSLLRG